MKAPTDLSRTRLDPGSRLLTLGTAALALAPLLLQLPGQLSLGIAAIAVITTALSWRRPLPGVLRLLLSLLVLVGVFSQMGMHLGRDTGCALLAAMLAIKPSETSTLRDARSLIGFALFAPFAAFLLDQGPLSMSLGLVAVLCALIALQRLADVEGNALTEQTSPWARLPTVGRLVLIGLPLALAAFWLFPRLGSPLWGIPDRAVARPGLSDSMSPGEWLDLMVDDSPALRAQFNGATPASQELYWRGPVLWDFDGRTWTQPEWIRGLPAEPVQRLDRNWDYSIEFEPTERRQLVALDLPVEAPAGTHLSLDYGLFSDTRLTSLTRWHLQSSPPRSFEPTLRKTLRQRALALPDGYNPRTQALAAQWRRDAGDDDEAIVRRAMEMIRKDFIYTLDTPLPGRHAVDEFLFDGKQGFCEHFSSAFVVLMRGAGIPARVVTGYAGGYHNRFGGYWIVRNMDAHAWAEVWLPERGWVRVDPTAAVAPERVYDTIEDRVTGAGGAMDGLVNIGDFGDWMRRGWNDLVLGFDATRQQRMLQPLGIEHLEGGRLGLLFGLFALITLGWMGWLLARGERERDPLLRAWRKLGARYAKLGLERQPHEPAGTWAKRVAAARPQAATVLWSLSQRFAAARYAASIDDKALVKDLRQHRP